MLYYNKVNIKSGTYYSDFEIIYEFKDNFMFIKFTILGNTITEKYFFKDSIYYNQNNEKQQIEILENSTPDKLILMYNESYFLELKKYTFVHKLIKFIGFAI